MKCCNSKLNPPLRAGLVLGSLLLFTHHLYFVPEMLKGFLAGLAFVGYILGIYGLRHDLSKLTAWKKRLIKRA
ncbi:hypothetical protein [Acetanaerobacterium elongatum]|uniref:Uncharacterized protein n=1 Tax=Acetanaerobacterium elongatum TaxID=258515 RepID=A0A1G9XPD7_9FIRM|nr:hypothetical protein [Acetanaerobacterium elongatum]SDM98638.1 hypothetical protein SAMN05192585_1094 [Acetanaerobacterium elongatum]